MKNNFKILKKPLAKSILAGFVTSFTVLSCVFFCCSAMNVDGSVDPTIFAHDINDILRQKSETEKGNALYQILNENRFGSEKDKEKYCEKLITAVETACEKMEENNISNRDCIWEISLAVAEGKNITPDMFKNNSDNIKNLLNWEMTEETEEEEEEEEEWEEDISDNKEQF